MAAEITKTERVSHPAVRFIGKRYDTYPNWSDFWENNWFEQIENAGERAAISDDSYCVLVGSVNGELEYYLGEFFPEGTPVPEVFGENSTSGSKSITFDFVDLPAMDAALFFIKGQAPECYGLAFGQRDTLNAAMVEAGITPPTDEPRRWIAFERDNCPRWTDPDEDGRQILDYAIYL